MIAANRVVPGADAGGASVTRPDANACTRGPSDGPASTAATPAATSAATAAATTGRGRGEGVDCDAATERGDDRNPGGKRRRDEGKRPQ